MVTLTHLDGQVFEFDAGALCLELLLSGGEGEFSRWERLHGPADLAAFCATTTRLHVEAGDLEVDEGELAVVRRLRRALWAATMRLAAGEPPLPADLDTFNEVAAGPGLAPRLDPGTRSLGWHTPISGGQLAAEFARDAVVTFAEPTVHRVRKCADPTCFLMYLDTSRPGQRRWCSMQRCGNRSKVRSHRSRREPQ